MIKCKLSEDNQSAQVGINYVRYVVIICISGLGIICTFYK